MVLISKDLAENLLDDVNDLLSSISDLRKYERYNRRCVVYEAEILELKAALKIAEAAKPDNQQLKQAIALLNRWMDDPDQDMLLSDTDRFVRDSATACVCMKV